MLDWKILAAACVALLIASTVVVSASDAGIGDFFGDIFNRISEWLKSSPFGGFFHAPVASVKEADILLYPSIYTLKTSSGINLSVESFDITGFTGDIEADFVSKRITFMESGTALEIGMPMRNITISDIKADKIYLEATDFVVTSEGLDTSGQNTTIEIADFSGEVSFYLDHMRLQGNVSMVRGNSKDIV